MSLLAGKAIKLNHQLKNGVLLSQSGDKIYFDYKNVKSDRVKSLGAKVLYDLNNDNDKPEAINVIFVAETTGSSGNKLKRPPSKIELILVR